MIKNAATPLPETAPLLPEEPAPAPVVVPVVLEATASPAADLETSAQVRTLQPAADATPMGLLQMAVAQGADLDRLERLMALQERWEANEARKAFVEALAAFKAEAPVIFKNKHVKFATSKGTTEYSHATLDEVALNIGAAMSPHGLSFRWNVEQNAGRVKVTCTITHKQGHSESVAMEGPADDSGSKNNIQAVGSTVTYLQRYTLLAASGMAVKDQDDDGAGGITFEVEEGLQSLAEAKTMAQLEGTFRDLYKRAQQTGNKKAMAAYIKAKDARKGELR